jgi:hypothetical protein
MLIMMLLDRLLVLQDFNFRYVGNDDMVFWQAARDYSHGLFYEPFFYGQNYNFMLEALFAAPLVSLGVPYYFALPITSAFVCLFPYLLFSVVLFRRGFFNESLVFLFIPLCLPLEYGMMSSMTRGFVSGIFFAGFYVFPLLSPNRISGYFICALAFVTGYIVNANSLIISCPVILYMWLVNFKRPVFYIAFFVSVAPLLWMEKLAKGFYESNPDYNIHSMWRLDYSFADVLQNMQILDEFFTFFTPVAWPAGWLIMPLIFVAGLYLFKHDWRKATCLVAAVLFTFMTLGVNKVSDAINSILLSSARMYLAIPLLGGLAFLWCKPLWGDRDLRYILLTAGITCLCVKASISKPVIKMHTAKMNHVSVALKKVEEVRCNCRKFAETAVKTKADLVAFVPNWTMNHSDMEFYNYGCPVLEKEFPPTIMSSLERRTWVYQREKKVIRSTVLLIGLERNNEHVRLMPGHRVLSESPPMILVSGNDRPLGKVLIRLGYEYSR